MLSWNAIYHDICNFLDEIFKYPEYPLCIGEYISIDCFFDYNRRQYISNGSVYFSFNGSTPISYQINSENQTENGVDLRGYDYEQDVEFLDSYLYIDALSEQDFFIDFACHLLISNNSFSEDVISTRIERAGESKWLKSSLKMIWCEYSFNLKKVGLKSESRIVPEWYKIKNDLFYAEARVYLFIKK